MALPTIAAYALPTADDLPSPRVTWALQPHRTALLIHDMQRYFVGAFPAGEAPIAPVIENITALRAACATAGAPVFFSAQPGRQDRRDRGLQADFWGPGMSDDPNHRSIAESLTPGADDVVLVKSRYSAFQRTAFEAMLRARGRDQLIVCGVYADIGCQLTSAEAFMRDIQPFFVADATAAFTRVQHDAALRYVASCCGVVTTTDRVTESLS